MNLKRAYRWCRECDERLYARPNSRCPNCDGRLHVTRGLIWTAPVEDE
jgi:Zn finger protein HypA/HybF involved in hydrogenase expression